MRCEKHELGKFLVIDMMKHLVIITLGGRLSLQKSLGTYPICRCISTLPDTIPEDQQPSNSFRGEMAPSNLMPPRLRKWPVVINAI